MRSSKLVNTSIDYVRELIYKKIREIGLFIDINISIDFKNSLIIIDCDKIIRYKKILEREFVINEFSLNKVSMNLKQNLSNILGVEIISIKKMSNELIKIYLK